MTLQGAITGTYFNSAVDGCRVSWTSTAGQAGASLAEPGRYSIELSPGTYDFTFTCPALLVPRRLVDRQIVSSTILDVDGIEARAPFNLGHYRQTALLPPGDVIGSSESPGTGRLVGDSTTLYLDMTNADDIEAHGWRQVASELEAWTGGRLRADFSTDYSRWQGSFGPPGLLVRYLPYQELMARCAATACATLPTSARGDQHGSVYMMSIHDLYRNSTSPSAPRVINHSPSTRTHELFHALGFLHNSFRGSVMGTGRTSNAPPSVDDLASLYLTYRRDPRHYLDAHQDCSGNGRSSQGCFDDGLPVEPLPPFLPWRTP